MSRKPYQVFLRGFFSMGLVVLVLYVLNSLQPKIVFPPAVIAFFVIENTPGDLATRMIEALGKTAIRSLAIGVDVAVALGGGLLAVLISRATTMARKARRALVAAALLFVGAVLISTDSIGGASVPSAVAYALAALAFVKMAGEVPLLSAIEPKKVEGDETPLDAMNTSRRSFIVRAGWIGVGLLGSGSLINAIRKRSGPKVAIVAADRPYAGPPDDGEFPFIPGQTPEITANDDFYNVDINIVKPAVDHTSWKLTIGGLVDEPYELSFAELQNDFEVVEIVHTLTCISNRVGGDLISTAVWRGVRLRDVLKRAGLQDGVVDLVFAGAEGYTDSVPLAKALEDDTLVVFGMNGQALPREHGFPARIIVPGIYGMKNVKWLTGIEAVGVDYKGYWMVRGWSDTAVVKTSSRIDLPAEAGRVRSGGRVAGAAWAGDRGIRRVEVSTDGGKTWTEALLKRELSPLTWRMWASEIDRTAGEATILVRAVDGTGKRQNEEPALPHPAGADGYHTVRVTVT